MTNIYGININESRDKRFSEEGLSMLERYYSKDQSAQHALAKVVNNFSYGDVEMVIGFHHHPLWLMQWRVIGLLV
jgi:hypothetical protein